MKRRSVVWTDIAGKAAMHTLNTNSGADAVQGQIVQLSNATPSLWWEGDLLLGSGAAVNVALQSVYDQAVLIYETATGSTAKIVIPAPNHNIFQADGETVDPAAVAGLNAVVLSDETTSTGVALIRYVAGLRNKRYT